MAATQGFLCGMAGEALRKMAGSLIGGHVQYTWRMGTTAFALADRIGGPFTLRFTGERTCTACGRAVKKFYGQGLCFPCLQGSPEASECIVRPERCRAHLGEGRDPAWELAHHAQEHVVYLACTSAAAGTNKGREGIKVGVTRATQVPVRWIDQGAVQAVAIARTPYRQLAGALEVALKALFTDRTDWRRMLQQVPTDTKALIAARTEALAATPGDLQPFLLHGEQPVTLSYPLAGQLPKVVSISSEKLPEITGTLLGIKGQYLVWKDGRVLNVRNHAGHHVEVG